MRYCDRWTGNHVEKRFIDRPLELRSLRALLATTAMRRGKEIVLIFTDI